MAGRIFLKQGESGLTAMEESPYDSEKLLQEMLANHPDLLAGEQIDNQNPRRWLLIDREVSVPAELDGDGVWFLDHLFLDQDAVPTLVEVKRSSDRRIRRRVVGQMLDYAANAVAYWPIEKIRSKFANRCLGLDQDPDEVLVSELEIEDEIEGFWLKVKTNLQAGRIRMIFLADTIPNELRRIVEFLNEQMDPAEVLAIEVRQFVGDGVKTFIPRVFGQTESARLKKTTGTDSSKTWDETSLIAAVAEAKGAPAEAVVKDLLNWLQPPRVTRFWWGSGAKEGGVIPLIELGNSKYHVCRIATPGRIVICFDWLARKPPFSDELLRRELLNKINQIPGVSFGEETLTKRARIQFEKLLTPESMENLKGTLTWLIDRIKAQNTL